MADKTLNVRLKLKYDSYENWSTNNPVLLAGEVALVYIPTDKKVENVNGHEVAGDQPPHILMKVGDGVNKFSDLKYVSGLAADVNSYAKLSGSAFETQIKQLAKAEVSADLQGNSDAISALEKLVGSESVSKQIADAITALELAETYAAKKHEHTVSEITDFDSSVKAYGYATKAEAQGYANAKDAAIAAAKKAGDDAQADVDALELKIGTVGEGQTVMGLIDNIQKNAYDDTEIRGLITENTTAISAEKSRAEGIEAGLRTDVDTVKADYLKTSDKTELSGLIETEAERAKGVEEALQNSINLILDSPDDDVVNSIKEFTDYIAEHGEVATGMQAAIDKNKEDIAANTTAIANNKAAIEKNASDIEANTTLIGTKDAAMDARVKVLEGIDHNAYIAADTAVLNNANAYTDAEINKINTAIGGIHTHNNKSELDKIQDGDVARWNGAQAAAEATAAAALAAAKTEISSEIDADVKVVSDALAAYKTANDAEVAKKANDADLAAIAKSGSTDDLVQGLNTLVLDCGSSTF